MTLEIYSGVCEKVNVSWALGSLPSSLLNANKRAISYLLKTVGPIQYLPL